MRCLSSSAANCCDRRRYPKNRICGDKLAKAGETTYTWTSYPWSKKTKNILMPAGLLGPVTITLYK